MVGGGFAGLAAAARLRARGAHATVLEAGPQAGGRAAGEGGDRHPGLLSGLDRGALELIGDSGAADGLLPLRPVVLAQVQGGAVHEVDRGGGAGALLPPGIGLRTRARLRRLPRLLDRFGDILDAAVPERATRLDDRSADDWSRLYFGRAARDRWAGPRMAELLQDPAETSRVLAMLEFLRREAAPRGVLRADLAGWAANLAGDDARFGTAATAVEPAAAGARVKLESETLEADAVVLATRADLALSLLGPAVTHAERDLLGAVTHSPTLCLGADLERPGVDQATYVRVPPCEPGPLASLLIEPGGEGARVPANSARVWLVARSSFAAAQAGAPDESVCKDLLGALQRVLPGTASGASGVRLHREQAGVVRFDVGAYRRIASFRTVQSDLRRAGRRIYFAGDHLVAPTLEGAVRSGLRAAEEIAEDLA